MYVLYNLSHQPSFQLHRLRRVEEPYLLLRRPPLHQLMEVLFSVWIVLINFNIIQIKFIYDKSADLSLLYKVYKIWFLDDFQYFHH